MRAAQHLLYINNLRRDYADDVEDYNTHLREKHPNRADALGFEGYRLYDLGRHTFNTLTDVAGVREAVRMAIMGQQYGLNGNNIYNHELRGEMAQAARQLEGYFLPPLKGERAKTPDQILTKIPVIFGQGFRFWWLWADLNRRHHDYESCALTS